MNLDDLCEPLARDIRIVKPGNEGRFPFSAAFLFTGERNVLVDAGCGVDRLRKLRELLPIHELLLTHTHPDHIAGAWLLEGAEVRCPEETPDGVEDLDALASRYTGGGRAAEQWKGFVTSVMGLRPPRITGRYADGEILLETGSVRLRALHAPGHTRDHDVFLEEHEGILFSADIDLTSFGPWYGHRESSVPAFRASIRRIRSLPFRLLVSSHRAPLTRRAALEEIDRFEQGFERQKEALRRTLREAGRPLTVTEIRRASPFYGNAFPDLLFMHGFEEWMVRHLLEEMVGEGEVIREPVPPAKDAPPDHPDDQFHRLRGA